MQIDFEVRDEGTIWLLKPVTQAARDWIGAHIPDEALWFGGAIAVEHRYIDAILCGIGGDGLTIE